MIRSNAALWEVLSPAGQLFVRVLVASRLDISVRCAKAIWRMISNSEDHEAQVFVFHTGHLIDQLDGTSDAVAAEAISRYFSDWLTPDLLHQALDELVARGELSPTAGARAHAHMDHWTSPDGRWRWTAKER